MGSYFEQTVRPAELGTLNQSGMRDGATTAVVTDDVTIYNWTATDTTVTPTRVDTGQSPGASGTATFNGTDSVAAANLQAVIRALGGIYANVTVTPGVTADNMLIRTPGGYNITWAKTGGTGTITESGAAGSDTAVVGKVVYTSYFAGRGAYVEAKRLLVKGFNDNAVVVTITDAANRGVFTATLDTSTANADVPYLRLITAAGVAGEDGAAAANTSSGVFDTPLKCVITTSAPMDSSDVENLSNRLNRPGARVSLILRTPFAGPAKGFLKRSTGAATSLTGTVNLGEQFVNIKRIDIKSSSDTTVAPTYTDADGLVVYTKTSSDFTGAGVSAQLSHEGVNQANGAVADLLDVIAKSPITVSGSGLGAGTFTTTFIVEV